METTQHARPARMEFKTTSDTKQLLNQHASSPLTKDGQAALVRLLAQSPQPTAEMQQLMHLPDLPTRQA